MRLRVMYSPLAAEQLRQMKERAEARPNSSHGTVYRAHVHLIEELIGNGDLATLPQNRLTGSLAGVFRVKPGRGRIFYIVSREQSCACVLMLGYRKAGDKQDAYAEFERRLQRGEFDRQLEELGQKRPH